MKTSFLFCVLIAFVCVLDAQIVNIPDVYFKTSLISSGIDTNSDGEIQYSEAIAVTYLDVSFDAISDMTGIEAFINLDTLKCSGNSISSLNTSNLTNLNYLDCGNNDLTNLDVSMLINLTHLGCSQNQLSTLNVSNLLYLQNLDIASNVIQNIDVSPLINLIYLNVAINSLSTLDVSTLVNLENLICLSNQLSSLDISNLGYLTFLDCSQNTITNIDLSNAASLFILRCSENQLTALDGTNLVNLSQLECQINQITTLNLSNSPQLNQLNCEGNQINTLFVKNGSFENNLWFLGNPPLQYICADANQLLGIEQTLSQAGITNISVNSFCSFPPGGNYNTLWGKSLYDADLNGCTLADSAYPFLIIEFADSVNTAYGCTGILGDYDIFLDAGIYSLTPILENPAYFLANPTTTNISFPNNSNNTLMGNFCIAPNGVFLDVEVVISPLIPSVPGFDATYQIGYHNKGTTTVSGDITLDFMGNKMTFVSASTPPISQNANQLTWNYSNLQPFESRVITVEMNILPPPMNNVGDMLVFTATAPLNNDADIADNLMHFPQVVIGSYDPNDKTCLEGNQVSNTEIGEYLHYLIRFQNTGTLYAEKVVVIDSIDASKFDISSLQIMEMSHLGQVRITSNVVEFYFDQIMLPDSFTNEPLSHGYILFKIKTKSSLPFNSVVKNKAEIYFDYNLPVVTNTAITTFSNATGIAAEIQAVLLKCYPNPAENTLTIETTKETNCVIVNILGEELIKQSIWGKQIIDISTLPKGLYWIKTQSSANGHSFVKE